MSQRAVLVGINYTGTPNALNGCINDVHRVATLLQTVYTFPSRNLVLMTDALPKSSPFYPTRANILRELNTMRSATQPGDVAVFHYSGHGIAVRNRASTNTEFVGTDGALIPADVFVKGKYNPGNEILDDTLFDWAAAFPGDAFVFSIIDACHSGSMMDLPYALKTHPNGTGFQVARVERRPDTVAKVILLSGCKDDQTSLDSVDSAKRPAGAMTSAFCDYINANAKKPVAYFEFLTAVRKQIVDRNKHVPNLQEPQLSFGRIADATSEFTLVPQPKTRGPQINMELAARMMAALEGDGPRWRSFDLVGPTRPVLAPPASAVSAAASPAEPLERVEYYDPGKPTAKSSVPAAVPATSGLNVVVAEAKPIVAPPQSSVVNASALAAAKRAQPAVRSYNAFHTALRAHHR